MKWEILFIVLISLHSTTGKLCSLSQYMKAIPIIMEFATKLEDSFMDLF